jgi:outer membrane protein OmpA-like peptidoglycan-associated protein
MVDENHGKKLTDNKGGLDYNLDLSKRQANAVVQALATDFQIAHDRLKAMGVASLSPVSSKKARRAAPRTGGWRWSSSSRSSSCRS